MRFYEITFPAFRLASDIKPERLGSQLVVEYADGTHKVIDDLDVPGETLGLRRLYIGFKCPGTKLLKLSQPIYEIVDLLHTDEKNFIDSAGKLFKYYKSRSGKVSSYLVDTIEPKGGGFILTCKDLHCKFFVKSAPQPGAKYAEILRVDLGFLFIKLSSTITKPYTLRI